MMRQKDFIDNRSSKYEENLARELSVQQWEFLADHFEGQRPIFGRQKIWNDDRVRLSLIMRKLVRVHPAKSLRPTHTTLTDKGHAVMCAALGLMADMLTKNGFDGLKQSERRVAKEKIAYGKFIITRPRNSTDDRNLVGSEGRPIR